MAAKRHYPTSVKRDWLSDTWRTMALLLGLALCGWAPGSANAMDRDARAVIRSSTWGTAAGTVLGAMAFGFSKDVRTVFQGSSIGLYFGIAFGLYHVTHREDLGNPLRTPPIPSRRSSSEDSEAPAFEWGRREMPVGEWRAHRDNGRAMGSPAILEARFVVASF